MELIPQNKQEDPLVKVLADGFVKETNKSFQAILSSCEDAIQRFWYRNKDEDGNPSLEGDLPTGIEVLEEMGTKAALVMAAAKLRKDMAVEVAKLAGRLDLVDESKLESPYELEFNPDGSLKSHSIK